MDGAVPAGAWPDHEQQALLILPGLVHSQPRAAEAECPGLPVGSAPPGAVATGAAMTQSMPGLLPTPGALLLCRPPPSVPPAPSMGVLGAERTVRRFRVLEGVY